MNIIGGVLRFYNWNGFTALLEREIQRFMKVAVQTVLAPLLSNILYLGVFGGILKTREIGVAGIDYLSFLVPGLAIMGAIFSSFQNSSFSLVSLKYQNTIQDLNSYPISNFEKTLAFVLGGAFRGLLVGTLTYITTIFFVGWKLEHPVVFFTMLGIVSFIFSSIGMICGLFFSNFEKINFVLTLFIMPMAYFGGVFFELSKLSGAFSLLTYINPIYPLVNITRYAYLGIPEGDISSHILFTVGLMICFFMLAFYALRRGTGVKIN